MSMLHGIKRVVNKWSFLQSVYDCSKALVHVEPFYLMLEGIGSLAESDIRVRMNEEDLSVVSLGHSDMKQLAETPGVKETTEVLVERLNNGWLCLGLKCGDLIIAHMWCNIIACDSKLYSFQLEHDEAYLTDARTLDDYRGKGLAPYLRFQFYKRLHVMGRNKLYSITEFFNVPAMNFKKKLCAKPIALYIHVRLLGKFGFHILIRRYGAKL